MRDVVALIPFTATEDWRRRALGYVMAWWERNFAGVPIVSGRCPPGVEWSKGAAIADALGRADVDAGVLVLADADSIILNPEDLRAAVELVRAGSAPWVVPHSSVYRLRDVETARLLAAPELRPRLGRVCRSVYGGIAGGGITVLTRAAFDAVGGVDPRFLGWGGEDVAFGYALETLVAPVHRLAGALVHLWHPPATTNLRGSEASEHLVGAYTAAYGFPRKMRHVLDTGEHPQPLPALEHPVRFRIKARDVHRIKIGGTWLAFPKGTHETDDPDHAEALRRDRRVVEDRR